MGGRPKGVGDHTELLVARLIGRNLTPLQGCIAQLAAIAIFGYLAWALFASGLIIKIVEPIAQWYATQAYHPPAGPSLLP
jgi:hypothetical protein